MQCEGVNLEIRLEIKKLMHLQLQITVHAKSY